MKERQWGGISEGQIKLLQELACHTGCNCGENQCFTDEETAEIKKAVAKLPSVVEKGVEVR